MEITNQSGNAVFVFVAPVFQRPRKGITLDVLKKLLIIGFSFDLDFPKLVNVRMATVLLHPGP